MERGWRKPSTSMPYEPPHPSFLGRFSDGKTAAARDISVKLGARGLELSLESAGEPVVWPYGALVTAEPLTAHAVDALVSYTYQPGASLFVPDGTFARRLAEFAPHLTARAARRRAATPWVLTAIAIVLVAVGVSMSQLSPARAVAGLMPDKLRHSLGSQTIRSMTSGKKVCDRPDGRRAVERLAERLSAGVPDGARFEITVVDWDLVNAFAAPGNQIVLTSGLIAVAAGPDEIAGVLAHEMGHGIELHPESGIVRAIGLTAAIELMMGGSGGTVANIGILLAQLSYTRQAEGQADERALSLLKAAQVSPEGFAGFFRRMRKEEGDGDGSFAGGTFDMLRTHPQTASRIRRIEQAERYQAHPALSGTDWEALKSMCNKAS